ncbi:patatin-like phospholipase family protein [Roseomonas rosulenta]|uniref:patatin-like phospholipase family protein n=1 Tax=Roseomonas rosulenta TaxID=2748667 RepID=UPI0018E01969|nr:patatin-like phospholipase family protein [Roseomonas rosulenta]
MLGMARSLCAALMLAILGACQGPGDTLNAPLVRGADGAADFGANYGFELVSSGRTGEHLVLLAFSGGGKRSAAFAHGALEGMRRMPVGRTTLLDQVDYISAVSGGSFPAVHYGLYREDSFSTFREDFLDRDINAYIYGTYLLPWHWEWVVRSDVGTNDRMARVYDTLMFRGATFGDLARRGPPLVSVNATDIANGVPFPFLGTTFGLICSDLNAFPLARAVAASNGFPVLFSAITLRNHADRCGTARPRTAPPREWSDLDGEAERRAQFARLAERYADPARQPWVHLLDGGISDNLALRGLLYIFLRLQDEPEALRSLASRTRRVIVISVDGEAAQDPQIARQRSFGGLSQILGAVSGTQIDAYNFETRLVMRRQVADVVERLRAERCRTATRVEQRNCRDVDGAFVHLSLADVGDESLRTRLQMIPTGLTIPRADVDALLEQGINAVTGNARIRELLAADVSQLSAARDAR